MTETDKIKLFLECLGILYLESTLEDNPNSDTKGVINTILNNIPYINSNDTESISLNLLNILRSVIKGTFDASEIKNTVLLMLKNEEIALGLFKDIIADNDYKEKTVVRFYKSFKRLAVDLNIKRIFRDTHRELNKPRGTVDVNQVSISAMSALENVTTASDDEAITEEVVHGDKETMHTILDTALESILGRGKLRQGWKAFNRMTQGGYMDGEFIVGLALQHNYKSGMAASAILHSCIFNTPVGNANIIDYFSTEDKLHTTFINIFFMLYARENDGNLPILTEFNSKQIEEYTTSRLEKNGWRVNWVKINPSEWNYKKTFIKVVELEKKLKGHTRLVVFDYLGMVPTTGCRSNGPMGTDVRDLFRRTRNFFGARNTTFLTLHQLNPDAKKLLRNGLPEASLTREVVGKGYSVDSSQLDQEYDLEFYMHKVKYMGKSYLSIARGKHRGHQVIKDTDMHFLLPFPEVGYILDDVESDKDISIHDLTEVDAANESSFDENIF